MVDPEKDSRVEMCEKLCEFIKEMVDDRFPGGADTEEMKGLVNVEGVGEGWYEVEMSFGDRKFTFNIDCYKWYGDIEME